MAVSLIGSLGGNAGFGENLLPATDDGSTGEIFIDNIFENGLNFFGTVYDSLWVNNNGSVSFDGFIEQYDPLIISSDTRPAVFAFWADVDTRGQAGNTSFGGNSQGTNLVYYDLDAINDRIVVTWDDVGYFSENTDFVNAFQLILTDASLLDGRNPGDFDIEFRYESINWAAGDVVDGPAGGGNTVARAGYSSGNGTFFELPQSGIENEILALENTPGNTGIGGLWQFSVVNGTIVPPIPPGGVDQDVTLDAPVNEGDSLELIVPTLIPDDISLPFPGTGTPEELISAISFDEPVVSGDAELGVDYTFSYQFGEDQVIRIEAIDDDIVEDDETATIQISGTVDWIVPGSDSGSQNLNLLGNPVFGDIVQSNIDITVDVVINSAPEGDPSPIRDITFVSPQIIGNVLTNFTDGSEETFTAIPASFDDGVVAGTVAENGDLLLNSSSAEPNQSVLVPFTVIDERGAQTLSAQEIVFGNALDDFLPGETASEFGTISVGTSELGDIERTEDRDRFDVFLEGGFRYQVGLESAESTSGTLVDPEIFGVFDGSNIAIEGSADNDSGVQKNALAEFIVETSGIYQIEVGSHTFVGTGGYRLNVESLGALDDFLPGDFTDIFGSVEVDGIATGDIETVGDRDRFNVELGRGIEYSMSLEGIATGGGSLGNPVITGVYDSSGNRVPLSFDDDSGVDSNALLSSLTVEEDGMFQVEVAGQGETTGDYTLRVEFRGFIDDFQPGIAAGFGDTSVGGRITGEIEASGDVDGFRVFLDASTTYEINIRGAASGNGTLEDPDLLGVFRSTDFDANPIDSVQTLNPGFVGDDSRSFFTPDSSGDFFIGVQDSFGETGTYAVEIVSLGVRDDFAADVGTTGSIVPNGSSRGRIDFQQDEDWFEVFLTADRLYEIELVPEDGAEALADPFFRGIYDANGVLIEGTSNDDGGTDRASFLQFVPEESGTFYLSAGGFGDTTGQYQLVLNDRGDADDDSFDITLQFTSDDTPTNYILAFEEAAERWEEIIVGDIEFDFVGDFGYVDDILIQVSVLDEELTFPGVTQTILANTFVLDQRDDGSMDAGLPSRSLTFINPEVIGQLRNLDELAANTIGRALGFGSLWTTTGIVQEIDGVATYTGPNGLREIAELSDNLNAVNVLEDGEDGALAAEYWSEAILDSELMTPRVELRRPADGPPPLNRPDNPISELTIAAMQDLGYVVNYDAADSFSVSNGFNARVAQARTTPAEDGVFTDKSPQERLLADLPNNDEIPNGAAYIHTRANSISENPSEFNLNASNSEILIASGTSVFIIEGATGENLTIELTGTFDKNNPSSVSDLRGTVDTMEVYTFTGLRLFSIDHSQRPVAVDTLLSQWPNYSMDGENVIIVDTIIDTTARINPNGGGANESRIFAGASDDYVRGGNTAELINGGADNDSLVGQGGDDSLIGEDGNDSLDGGTGNDLLNGGAGTDTVMSSGNQASYTLTLSASDLPTLQDRRSDGNGLDTLANIDVLDFDTNFGGADSFALLSGSAGLSAAEFESFIELYIAYFNRAPDAVGLNFWGNAFANGTTFEQMAAFFIDQDETRAVYPEGTSNNEFVTAVYNNVLGRTPDQEGINFWVGSLESGQVSRDQFILEALRGAKSELKPELGQDFVDQQLADRAYLENKTDIGAYFAVHKGMSDVNNASSAMALFDGSQGSINAAVAAIDNFYNAALDPNNGEFLLTVVGVLDDPFSA